MQKTLKALAAVGIMSCVVYAIAQESSARIKGGEGQGTVAGEIGKGKFAPINGAQETLRTYIMAIDNRNVERANQDKREGIAQACVDVQCFYWLTTARPDERKHIVDDVWQISKYRPNGQWNHITSAPILVDELIRIDKKTSDGMQKIIDDARDVWFAQFHWKDKRLDQFKGKTWPNFTPAEKDLYVQINKEARDKWLNGRTTADVADENAVFLTKAVNEAKKLLSPAQLAEFNRLVAAFDKDMAKAYAGKPVDFATRKGN